MVLVMSLSLEYNMLLLGYYKQIKKCGGLCPVLSPSPIPLFLLVFIYFICSIFKFLVNLYNALLDLKL